MTRLVVLLVAALVLPACASWQGARLYASGSEAIDRGDTDQAIADLEQAAELVPQSSEIHNHLGIAYLSAGRTADAERAFQRAVDLDCDNAAAAHNLAVLAAGPRAAAP